MWWMVSTMTTNVATLLEQRVRLLLRRLNTEQLTKKQRKGVAKELVGYGVIPVHFHKRYETVYLGEGIHLYGFPIDRILETTDGPIIGYYCPDCFATASVNDAPGLILPDGELLRCMYCNSSDVSPLYLSNVVEEGTSN